MMPDQSFRSDFTFMAAMLRFVADKTQEASPAADLRAAALVAALRRVAGQVAEGGAFEVAPEALELTARALAGFAAFLQKSILPEAVAHGNTAGEAQIRWGVDSAMEAVNTLLSRAAQAEGAAVRIILAPPRAMPDPCPGERPVVH